jgi:hypothetical protein
MLDATLDRERVRARGDVAQTLADDRLREDRRGRRAVAGDVVRLGRDFLDQLRAHVLERVGELDLLGDRDAVVGDRRRAEFLVEDDVASLGAERNAHRVGQDVRSALKRAACGFVEYQFFCSHDLLCDS